MPINIFNMSISIIIMIITLFIYYSLFIYFYYSSIIYILFFFLYIYSIYSMVKGVDIGVYGVRITFSSTFLGFMRLTGRFILKRLVFYRSKDLI